MYVLLLVHTRVGRRRSKVDPDKLNLDELVGEKFILVFILVPDVGVMNIIIVQSR